MNKTSFIFGMFLGCVFNFFGINHAYSNETLKIEDFVKLADSRDVKISPDGKHLSIIFRKNGEDVLAVVDRKTQKPINAFRVRGKGKAVGNTYWVNNERLVYSVTESYAWNKAIFDNGELIGVNVDGSKHDLIFGYRSGEMQTGSRLKTKVAEYGNQEIIDFIDNDDENILIAFYPWKAVGGYWRYNPNTKPIMYKLNVYTGKKRKVGFLPMPGADAITDNDGNVRFSIGINNKNKQEIHYKKDNSDEWQRFLLKDFEGESIRPLSFTADNNSVYLSANVGNGTRALYLLNLKNKSTKKIFHDKRIDISFLLRDFSDKRIVGIGTDLALPEYQYIEKKDPKVKLHKMLLGAFNGNDVLITSSTKDSNYAVVFVYSDTNSGDYYLFDTQTLKAKYLLSKRSHIHPELMAQTDSVIFSTRDGTTIYGYLTKPKGKSQNLPLVVLPHGGPHGVKDSWGYDWEVQLLANRGYAVLQVNYRGSSGFGTEFEEAGYGKWGTLMQDDITDATLSVIKQGIADSNRICIYGASYGGYAALMGVVREPSLYQCAIGSVGVYNLPMMFEEGDIADRKSGIAYLKEVLGENVNDQKKRSPVFNVDKIKAEVLLIHGAKDKRAPIEQAESLKEAFDKIGKKYDWLELSNEGHGYYDEGNRLTVYTKVLDFLDRNIGKKKQL